MSSDLGPFMALLKSHSEPQKSLLVRTIVLPQLFVLRACVAVMYNILNQFVSFTSLMFDNVGQNFVRCSAPHPARDCTLSR